MLTLFLFLLHTRTYNLLDPSDYTGVTTTVTFPAGVTEQFVSVVTIDDSDAEPSESFTATLSNPSPSSVVVISEPQATVNIADNEGKIIQAQSFILLHTTLYH